MIVILTLSNKPNYLPDAIASVLAQTRRDLRHVIAIDAERDWQGCYPPAVFYNEQAKAVDMADYVSWLSDDDILLPNYVADLAGYLDAHPDIHCVYGRSRVEAIVPGRPPVFHRHLPEQGWSVFSAKYLPAYRIDGGQVMIRRSALEAISYPYYPEGYEGARACDATMLNKAAIAVGIYPVEKTVMVNRVTPISSHVASRPDGSIGAVDWTRLC